MVKSRRLRPLFTLVVVGLGAVGGYALANAYCNLVYPFFLVPKNQATDSDRMLFRLGLAVVGALFGFVFERLSFVQFTRSRARWESMDPRDRMSFFAGLIMGLVLTALIHSILPAGLWINISLAVILCWISVVALDSVKEQMRFYFASPLSQPIAAPSGCKPKLLDTNVIIDGKIADICRAELLEGPLYVPKFVLEELQRIADSSDSLKRARGRRGLEILNQMQKEIDLEVRDYPPSPGVDEVDARLVVVASESNGAIVTNDYNLNKVAELQGVEVLNINELANAVKPVVLPGEEMRVTIIREGKEKEQGIGYLDDGTMVVVEGARGSSAR